ncbi:MAG: Rne/Rng family ribonuclease [Gorillibacterium sp.]|nr:Rne/Rng family ribonuclease [Gorillibacterium sp.]
MKKIVVQWENGWSRVALLENGRLAEFYLEGPDENERAGNIYKGRVVNVLPGMEAAFVDIGLGKNAFLYRDELLPPFSDDPDGPKPPIQDLVRVGQELLVQVKKETQGGKGARVTTRFSFPGRWMVYMPGADHTAISRKIEAPIERQRLKAWGEHVRKDHDGMIIRTAAAGHQEETLEKEWNLLHDLWAAALSKSQTLPVPCLIYRDLDLIPRLVRDLFTDQIDELVINDKALGRHIIALLDGMAPGLSAKIHIYRGAIPLFEAYPVQSELERAFKRKIPLDCGGHLVVDKTEAMTVIDVNTGGFTGKDDLEDTVFRTNLEAAAEIVRLLRLRDIGGMIVVDFIDMKLEQHRHEVRAVMEQHAEADRSKPQLIGWTKLGLFEITRTKRRQTLEGRFYETCVVCGGLGRMPTALLRGNGDTSSKDRDREQ